jgi:hypothetical protein
MAVVALDADPRHSRKKARIRLVPSKVQNTNLSRGLPYSLEGLRKLAKSSRIRRNNCEYVLMPDLSYGTTVDLPDPLFRRAKAIAALRGSALKDLIVQAAEKEVKGQALNVSECQKERRWI